MTCQNSDGGPFRCPTFIESLASTLALLPRGRAWPANDGGGIVARYLAWLNPLSAPEAPAPGIPAYLGGFFGRRYFGAHYWGRLAPGAVAAGGAFAGPSYFGRRFFGARYWGVAAPSEEAETSLPAPRQDWPAGYVQVGFFAAIAAVRHYLEMRLCALRLEFWCATHTETHDLWMEEYGLPDGCDPYPDLCAKVAAMGGARCEYYQAIAARAGWSIDCLALINRCGARAGCSQAGCAQPGSTPRNLLKLVVDLHQSPAYVANVHRIALAGHMRAGHFLGCGPNISALRCLIERIAPAHVTVAYVTI